VAWLESEGQEEDKEAKQTLAGPDAHWPGWLREEKLRLVQLEVQAGVCGGASAQVDTLGEKEAWEKGKRGR
jgi:hypothetical protein